MITNKQNKSQRGSALILVLWISLLLSLILVGIIAVSRSELRITKAEERAFLIESAARIALEMVAFEISTNRDQNYQFTSRTLSIDEFTVVVKKSDEAKKLDLNFTSEAELTRYFAFLGEDQETAQSIAAKIADWRDPDDLARPNGAETRDYVRARDNRRPGNRAFRSISELEQVLDISEDLPKCAYAGVTIFGDADGPDTVYLSSLFGRAYPRQRDQQSTTSLGTAARVNNAGGRYSLVAQVCANSSGNSRPPLNKQLGLFRVSGNPQQPYDWIAQMQLPPEMQVAKCDIN